MSLNYGFFSLLLIEKKILYHRYHACYCVAGVSMTGSTIPNLPISPAMPRPHPPHPPIIITTITITRASQRPRRPMCSAKRQVCCHCCLGHPGLATSLLRKVGAALVPLPHFVFPRITDTNHLNTRYNTRTCFVSYSTQSAPIIYSN